MFKNDKLVYSFIDLLSSNPIFTLRIPVNWDNRRRLGLRVTSTGRKGDLFTTPGRENELLQLHKHHATTGIKQTHNLQQNVVLVLVLVRLWKYPNGIHGATTKI